MYKDRGIIKWQPFDSLNGFRENINKMLYKKNKSDKKILLSDKLEEMDYILSEAINNNKELSIEYYETGYYFIVYGFINKIDQINKKIHLNNDIIIVVDDITNIEII